MKFLIEVHGVYDKLEDAKARQQVVKDKIQAAGRAEKFITQLTYCECDWWDDKCTPHFTIQIKHYREYML